MSARHNYNTPSLLGREHAHDNLADKAAEIASRNLLVAQLRVGQHSLDRERFWLTVGKLRGEGYL